MSLDTPRLLRASLPVRRDYDDPDVPLDRPSVMAEASEASGYTSLQNAAMREEPEAVSLEEQERQTRLAHEKRERVILSPLFAIDHEIAKLETTGLYKNADLRFIRKKLGDVGRQALRMGTDG